MKFAVSMLHDMVQTNLGAEALGDLLTMAGFELEGIEQVEGEDVLDIKVVSNRGDGLSVLGLAREVLAKDPASRPTDLYIRSVERFASVLTHTPSGSNVEIQTDECLRYGALILSGIQPGQAPTWIQDRLRRAGMRPISVLVDITNYVMLEQGQPLHAFDLDKLTGQQIVVRNARAGDKLTTLNGEEHELRADQMMICDGEKPVASAGIMGGLESEVTDSTTRCLVESANFRNTAVRRIRKQLGLSTEASYRFERSVDPELVVAGLKRFAELLLEAQPQVTIESLQDVYPAPPESRTISLSVSRTSRLLGMEVTPDEAHGYLSRLGFEIAGSGDQIEVTAPTWRPDIVREEDLIEEIGRVHGYEKIPAVLPQGSTPLGGVWDNHRREEVVVRALVNAGYTQTISHSLRGLHPLDRSEESVRVGPRNPASPEMAFLRDSVLPSLADALVRNGGKDLHLFEVGKVFAKAGEGYDERKLLGLLSTGTLGPANRAKETLVEADLFSLKAALEELARTLGLNFDWIASESPDPRFHPGRVADLMVQGAKIGVAGQVHPQIAEELRIATQTLFAEIDLDALLAIPAPARHLGSISRNPAVRRDLAVLLPKNVPFAKLSGAIREAVGDVLESEWLFDVYEGTGIPEGHHSLGIALHFRKHGENFTDEEANQVRERAVAAIVGLGGTMR